MFNQDKHRPTVMVHVAVDAAPVVRQASAVGGTEPLTGQADLLALMINMATKVLPSATRGFRPPVSIQWSAVRLPGTPDGR